MIEKYRRFIRDDGPCRKGEYLRTVERVIDLSADRAYPFGFNSADMRVRCTVADYAVFNALQNS